MEIGSSDEVAEISLAGVVGASDDVAGSGCWSEVDGIMVVIGIPDEIAETSSAGVVVASDDAAGAGLWSEVEGEVGSSAEVVEGS